MRNTNASNFTYRQSQFGPNLIPPPQSHIFPQSTLSNSSMIGNSYLQQGPVYSTQIKQQPIMTNQTSFGSVHPQQSYIQQGQPILIDQRQIVVPRTSNTVENVQAPPPVVHQVIQPKIIQQTVIHHSRMNHEVDNRQYYRDDPQVQTVNNSRWMSYYDNRKQPIPPPRGGTSESKSCCKAPILALLGLLALGGLIAAIILAANAYNEHHKVSHSGFSQGIPRQFQDSIEENGVQSQQIQYPQYSIKQQTVIIRNNAQDNGNQVQYPQSSIKEQSIIIKNNAQKSKSETQPQVQSNAVKNDQEIQNKFEGISPTTISPTVISPTVISPTVISPIQSNTNNYYTSQGQNYNIQTQNPSQKQSSYQSGSTYSQNPTVVPVSEQSATTKQYQTQNNNYIYEKPNQQYNAKQMSQNQVSLVDVNPIAVKPIATSSVVSTPIDSQNISRQQVNNQETTVDSQNKSTKTVTKTIVRQIEPLTAQPVAAHLSLRNYHQ